MIRKQDYRKIITNNGILKTPIFMPVGIIAKLKI